MIVEIDNNYQKKESWGFRNFRLFVYQCQSGCLVCSKTNLKQDCLIWMHLHSSYTDIDPNLFFGEGWIMLSGLTTQLSQCQTVPIICCSNICGKSTILFKTFYSLPAHENMKIKFKYNQIKLNQIYLKLDSWDSEDQAFLKVDGKLKWTKKLQLQRELYLYHQKINIYTIFVEIMIENQILMLILHSHIPQEVHQQKF